MIVKITTYGLPGDPFRRIVEERKLVGDQLYVRISVYPRIHLEEFRTSVRVVLEDREGAR